MPNGIFVGLTTLDLVYQVDNFPAPNTKIAARSQDLFAGGPATNASVTFQHLGGHATLVSPVGRHLFASAMNAEFARYGVAHIDLAPEFDGLPPIASITVNSAAERNIVSTRAACIVVPPAVVDESLLAQASIVLVDGHVMQACQAWAAAAHARGIPVVLDAGSWKAGLGELLANVDTAICSDDFHPAQCPSEDDVILFLKDCGVRRIAITHGADPIRFVSVESGGSGETAGLIRVPQIQAVDTMGSGDILHGAYCYYAASGLSFQQSLHEAATVAAKSCQFAGTRAWMTH